MLSVRLELSDRISLSVQAAKLVISVHPADLSLSVRLVELMQSCQIYTVRDKRMLSVQLVLSVRLELSDRISLAVQAAKLTISVHPADLSLSDRLVLFG